MRQRLLLPLLGLFTALGLIAFWTVDVLAEPGVADGLIDAELGDGGGKGLSHPVLGSHLSALADQAAAAKLGGEAATPAVPGDTSNGTVERNYALETVGLSITFDGDSDDAVQAIRDIGGDVRNIFDGYIEAYVPIAALADLAKVKGLTWARQLAKPVRDKGLVTSGGVAAHLADDWHRAGITGTGVKVGVIDSATTATSRDGFSGLKALMGTDIPSTVIARCYTDHGGSNATSDINNCTQPGDDHGTVVAETLMDVAPDATLYIANPNTLGDLYTSMLWMKSQGVQVINYSVSWSFFGPGDGTSRHPLSPLWTVKYAADNGIVWINAAGNRNGETWYGSFADADDDGIHEWTPGNEYQRYNLSKGENITVFMRWDDTWGTASTDVDLILVKDPGASETIITSAGGNDQQSGGPRHDPLEFIQFTAPAAGTYGVKAQNRGATAPSWIQLGSFDVLPHSTIGHSILVPAESAHPGMMAVGASSTAIGDIHGYSSLGPTTDGRIKPDIVGASGSATRSGRKYGTSFAAPHVAGLAALIRQQNPTFTPKQVNDYLKAHAHQRGSPVPNNTWGHGFAQLPSPDCLEHLNSDGTTSGTWIPNCDSDINPRKSSQYYTFTITSESTITIDLSSTVDSYLYLRSGYNNKRSAALHEDDDGGTGNNARISESLDPGVYTIEATTASASRTGTFSLTVSGGVATLSEISVSAGGDITEGANAVFTFTATPTPTSALDVTVYITADGDYGITDGKRTVTIPTTGSATLTLPTTNDTVTERHGTVTARVHNTTTYVASKTASHATVAITDDEGGVTCTKAITADGTVNTSLTKDCESHHRSDVSANFGPRGAAYARYYTFTISEAREVSFDLTVRLSPRSTYKHDSFLYLRKGDQTYTGKALKEHWDEDASISAILEPGTYTLEVTTLRARVSGYITLVVKGLSTQPAKPSVSVHAGPNVSEGGNLTLTVRAIPAPTADLDVTIALDQLGDFDYSPSEETTTVTIPTSGSATLTYATSDDSTVEDTGWVLATVQAGSGYTASAIQASASVSVSDDDGTPACGLTLDGNGKVPGEWHSGCLSQTSHRTDFYSRYYTFTLTRGSTVTIDAYGVQPETLDTYLILRRGTYNPNAVSPGYLETEDDDSGPHFDARLVWDLTPGTYTIEVTSGVFSRTSGRFTLSVKGIPDGSTEPEIRIAAAQDITEGGTATFYVTAIPAPLSNLDVTVNIAQTGDFGTATGSRTVTIGTGGTNTVIVSTTDDSVGEHDGAITATVVDATGYTVSSSKGTASVAVADNDGGPPCSELLTGNGSVNGTWDSSCVSTNRPGRYARFYTFNLSSQSDVEIRLNSAEDNYLILRRGKHALSGSPLNQNDDYSSPGTNAGIDATLTPGWYTIEATTYDQATTDTFTLTVSGLTAQPTIPEVSIAATAGTITEGGDATFTITANPAPSASLDVTFAVTAVGDFGVTPQTQTIAVPTSGSVTFLVSTTNDSVDEADGSVTSTINAGTGYTVSTTSGTASVTIEDDDSTAQTCNLPSDAVTTSIVIDWRDEYSHAEHVSRWNRVLAALGVDTGETAMTAADAETIKQQFNNTRWDRTIRTLQALEQCATVAELEISITAGATITEGGDATFTVTADPAPSANLDVTIAVTTVGDFGVSAQSHTVTIPTTGSATLTLSTAEDSVDEADGSVTATINTGSGYTVSSTAGAASVTVQDNDVPEIAVTAGTGITEGADATFTVSASPTPAAALDVTVTVSQTGAYGVATGPQTVTIPTSGSVTLTIGTSDDAADETDGSVTTTINSGTGYTVAATAGTASVSVADDDDPVCTPQLPSDAITVSEVKDWRDDYSHAAHVARWNRVLAALGESTGETAMTVADAEAIKQQFDNIRWDRTVRTLQAMAQCGNSPTPLAATPVISIVGGAAITEGGDATFTLSATPAPASALSVSVTVGQTGDFAAVGPRTVVIPTSGSATLTIATVNDSTDEPNGSISATVNSGQGYTVSSTAGTATVAVADNDDPLAATPVISIVGGAAITEGGDATFTLSATPAPASALSVSVTVGQTGDFAAAGPRTVVIPTSGSATLTIATVNDSTDEPNGSVSAALNAGQGYTVSSTAGSATVAVADNDDPPAATPVISIVGGAAITEGGDATFTLSATPAPASALSVSVTVGQTGDFAAAGPRTVVIPASGSATLTIATVNDSTDEPNGSVGAALNVGQGYAVSSTAGSASVDVTDDDVPVISITAGAGITEGGNATFTITANPTPHAALTVTVAVTQNGNYGVATGSLAVTIPTSGSATLTVPTTNDTTDETDGSVTATIKSGQGYTVGGSTAATVAVADDDSTPSTGLPSLSVADVTANEGDGAMAFSVTLSQASNQWVRLRYSLIDDTAEAQVDYKPRAGYRLGFGRVYIAPGTTNATISVILIDDQLDDGDKSFAVKLSHPNSATIADGEATGTIVDND